ncbi:metal-dependent hydrolase [candidate division KSB1 bacterium]|nr:metal-dependent hydrolase [candidate division KSB1 bacterium]
MSDFAGHSKAGLMTFLWILPIILLVNFWRVEADWLEWLKSSSWHIPLCFGLTYLGALFPDIDIKSKSQKIIYSIIIVFMALLIIYHYYGWAAGIGFFALLGIISKHRGFLHSRAAAFLLPLPLLLIPLLITARWRDLGIEFYLATVAGYLCHLKADEPASARKETFSIYKRLKPKKYRTEKVTNS